MMLAELVRDHRGEVVEFAQRLIEKLMPHRAGNPDGAYLPRLVDRLIADLDDGGSPEFDDMAAVHGREREELGIDIHLVTHDFGVICDAVADVAARSGQKIDGADWQKLNRALDRGIASAIGAYEAQRRHHERMDLAARLGGIAHELRNSLGAATAAFGAIRAGRVGSDSRTAQIVSRNLTRSALLATNLVAKSTMDARPELVTQEIALRPLVEDVAAILDTPGLSIDLDVAPELRVVADEQLLISAVTNLMQNAVKFTPAGGIVGVRARASADGTVIEVEDRCGGLPAGWADTLFAPFVKRGGDRRGAGLGLTIVSQIMAAHGGTVHVTDLPGRGCIFELRFVRK
jgi:signal transduction histidine kinase